MTDKETLGVYQRMAQDYADLPQDMAGDITLDSFVQALPKGARVLDLGCGPGHFAAEIKRRGFDAEGWDPAPEMVALARKAGITARVAGFDDLSDADQFDGLWVNFSLLHMPLASWPGYLARMHGVLAPGGILHVAVKDGTGENRDRLGRRYSYAMPAELQRLIRDAGFTVLDTAQGEGRGLDGGIAAWNSALAHA